MTAAATLTDTARAIARHALELRCTPHPDVPDDRRLAAFYDAITTVYGEDFAYAVGNVEAAMAAEGGR